MIRIFGKKSSGWKIILSISLVAGCAISGWATDTIAGVVRNRTQGLFAAADEVILLHLDRAQPNHGMQEEARTTTDSQGSFTLKVLFPDKVHLLRVIHQGANYDQPVSAGDVVSIDVFDSATKVQGITGSIEIIRAGTNGNLLHVSDMIEIRNNSSPPLTQAGERTFEVNLPAKAKIDSVLAAGPEKIGMVISAMRVPGEPGHYTVNFPLQPGATKLAFNYDLPYNGYAAFHTKSVYPLQQFVVMIPSTMKFTSRSPAFQTLSAGDNSYQVEAVHQVKAGEGPEFKISGIGAPPRLQAQDQPPIKTQVGALPTSALSTSKISEARTLSANAKAPSSGASSSSSQPLWWFLGSAVLLFGIGGFLLWGRPRLPANTMMATKQRTEQSEQASASLVEALKEELFQLEINRVRGSITSDEYDSAKQALEGRFQRAS